MCLKQMSNAKAKDTLRVHMQLPSLMLIVAYVTTVLGTPLEHWVVKSGYMARPFSQHLLTDLRPGHMSFASPSALEHPILND